MENRQQKKMKVAGFIGKKHYSGNRKRMKDTTTTEKDLTYTLSFSRIRYLTEVTFIPKETKVNLDVINKQAKQFV